MARIHDQGRTQLGAEFSSGSIEVCLNLSGTAKISDSQQTVELVSKAATFYYQGQPALSATRLEDRNIALLPSNFLRRS
jgi:hypothetical protein